MNAMELSALHFLTLMCILSEASAATCPAYPAITNGVVTYNPLSPIPQMSYETGAIATISCNLGFILHGPMTTKCGSNGAWEPNLGSCKPFAEAESGKTDGSGNTCGPVKHEMGTIMYLPGVQPPKFPSGSVAILSCPPGQSADGAAQAICQNGKWSATLGTCKQSNFKLF